MKKFLSRLGCIFISRTFAKVAVVLVTLIVFFYAEENWRGARAWAAAKARWETQGETFDCARFIPPPIPDGQNLAAIPLFRLEPYPPDNHYLDPLALQKAMKPKIDGSELPSASNNGGNAFQGDLPDMTKIHEFVLANYTADFGPPPPSMDILAQFEALYPFIGELRAASVTRPACRFASDYSIYPPFSRGLSLIVTTITMAKHLRVHAYIALDCQRPDLALDDLAIAYKLLHGAERDPSLVGGLVAIGINAIMQGVVFDGLARHAWNDGQLRQIEQILGQVDFLTAFQFAMKSEAAISVANIDYLQHNPKFQRHILFAIFPDTKGALYDPTGITWSLGPRNWWDYNKVQSADLALRQLALAEPAAHRVFPDQDAALNRQHQQMVDRWDAYAPWNIFVTVAVTNGFQGIAQKYAYAQTWLDQMRVACALERYRLAHGAYPATLSSLVPDDIETLPCDVITGEPLHYNLHPDGTYLLYSVGWDQKDDDGTLVFDPKSPSRIDYTQGDWVWPVLRPVTSP